MMAQIQTLRTNMSRRLVKTRIQHSKAADKAAQQIWLCQSNAGRHQSAKLSAAVNINKANPLQNSETAHFERPRHGWHSASPEAETLLQI
jgi:hypothetical protein